MKSFRWKCDKNISLTPSPTEEKQGQGGPDSGPEEGDEGQEGAVEDDGHPHDDAGGQTRDGEHLKHRTKYTVTAL